MGVTAAISNAPGTLRRRHIAFSVGALQNSSGDYVVNGGPQESVEPCKTYLHHPLLIDGSTYSFLRTHGTQFVLFRLG